MEIKSISSKIFRAAPRVSENNASHTNPFGVNFKGNMITADVFTAAVPEGSKIVEKVANRSKMLTSAIVGSVGSMTSSISARLNSIASFGRRIGERVSNTWQLAKNIEIQINVPNMVNGLRERVAATREFSVGRMLKQPVSRLEELLSQELTVSALGA